MRRQDDIIQLQDRIVGIGRLLRVNIGPCGGDAADLKCCGVWRVLLSAWPMGGSDDDQHRKAEIIAGMAPAQTVAAGDI